MPTNLRLISAIVLFTSFVTFLHAQQPLPAQTLELGKPVERELKGGEVLSFTFKIDSGQAASIIVDQRGIDVAVLLFAPDGHKVVEVDSPNGTSGPEPLSFIARVVGEYRLEVRSLEKNAASGRFEAKLEAIRQPTSADRSIELARKIAGAKTEAAGGDMLASEPDLQGPELAKAIYDEALKLLNMRAIPQALVVYKILLPLAERLNHRPSLVGAYSGLGTAYEALEKHDLAIEYHLKAIPLLEKGSDRSFLAQGLSNIGHAYRFKGEYSNALEFYQKSASVFEQIGNKTGQISALNDAALSYNALGDQQAAVDTLKKSLGLFGPFEHKRLQLHTMTILGSTYMNQGRYSAASDSFRSALGIAEEVKWTPRIIDLNGNIGAAAYQMGQSDLALDGSRKALQLADAAKNRQKAAIMLVQIGDIYYTRGDHDLARDHYERGLEHALSIKDAFGVSAMNNRNLIATAYNRLGATELERGNLTATLENYQKSLKVFDSLPDDAFPVGLASLFNSFGDLYVLQAKPAEAITFYEKALNLGERLEIPYAVTTSLTNMAKVRREIGDLEGSLQAAERAVEIALRINQRETLWAAHTARGRALSMLRKPDLALSSFAEAIKVIESIRLSVGNPLARASYFANVQEPYDDSIELLMQLQQQNPKAGHDIAAFEMSERRRARSLLESLSEANADIRQGVDAALLQREKDLRHRLAAKANIQAQAIAGRDMKEKGERAEKLKSEIAAITAEHQLVEAEIRIQSPKYAALVRPVPLTLRQIQREVLDPNTVLLEYSLGNERSFVWAVTNRSIASYELPKRTEIEAASRTVYDLLSNSKHWTGPDNNVEFGTAARKLSEMVLGPLSGQVAGKRLVVIADGALQYVPFGSLPGPKNKDSRKLSEPLAVSNEIVSLPSASTLSVLRKESADSVAAPMTVAVFADPVFNKDDERVAGTSPSTALKADSIAATTLERAFNFDTNGTEPFRIARLPFTRREADGIVAAAPQGNSLKAIDFAADRETALGADMSRYRVVHFATHGILHSEHPELSGIVLSLVNEKGEPVDGFLRVGDVYNMKLNADLVVLSACQTALGKNVRGEGLIGLTRGFMYAGSPRLVASLWKVDDVATAELMKIFYQKMLKEKMRPAAALREAKVAMWKTKRWNSPYYWAAFELQGDWR